MLKKAYLRAIDKNSFKNIWLVYFDLGRKSNIKGGVTQLTFEDILIGAGYSIYVLVLHEDKISVDVVW